MKNYSIPFAGSILVAVALCACGKTEPTVEAPVAPKAESAVAEPVKAAESAPVLAAPAVVAEAQKPVEPGAPVGATTPAAPADAGFQDLVAQARTLVAEKKYAEASAVVQQLSAKALNADQATIVAGLKEQIQKAVAAQAGANAGGALGNLLPK